MCSTLRKSRASRISWPSYGRSTRSQTLGTSRTIPASSVSKQSPWYVVPPHEPASDASVHLGASIPADSVSDGDWELPPALPADRRIGRAPIRCCHLLLQLPSRHRAERSAPLPPGGALRLGIFYRRQHSLADCPCLYVQPPSTAASADVLIRYIALYHGRVEEVFYSKEV
jgi:hypothetical protein